jgi:4-hydroxy-tetrahydrodipicolinate synthase
VTQSAGDSCGERGGSFESALHPTPDRSREPLARALVGISAVPVTPLHADGSLDLPALGRLVAKIVAGGVRVVVAAGNTGEQAAMSATEWAAVLETTLEAAGGVHVVAGLGGDLGTASQRAASAIEAGASGVMVHHPTDPYVTDRGIVAYYQRLAAATDGPLIPYVRGNGFTNAVYEPMTALPNVVAVKYAVPDVVAFADFAARFGGTTLPICGLAELYAPWFWLAGGRGFTSGLVNVRGDLSLRLLEHLTAGRHAEAMALWRVILPFEQLRARHGAGNNVPVIKEALALRGEIQSHVRPPLAPLSDVDRHDLIETLARLDRWTEVHSANA